MLGRSIKLAHLQDRWKGLTIARGIDPITHLQFVDDNFLLDEATMKEEKVVREVLDSYCRASSQLINWNKSENFFP